MPNWLFDYISSIPKVINKLLFIMMFCNVCLLVSVLNIKSLPNLGVSPVFLAFLLCAQNIITWFSLNNHRLSANRLPTIVANDFVVGTLLGICVGGSIVAFILSQFTGQISNCVSIHMTDFEYTCQHHGEMTKIWFWSGAVFWINTILSFLIIYARDDLCYLQHTNYESIGMALEELQSSFERNSGYINSSPNDGIFFGNKSVSPNRQDNTYPTMPSSEEAMKTVQASTSRQNEFGGYGTETGFDKSNHPTSAPSNSEAKQVFL
jgi:MFS family permease